MVLSTDFFATCTENSIVDTDIQMRTTLGRESRKNVDALMDAALADDGMKPRTAQDCGFMYSRDFEARGWELGHRPLDGPEYRQAGL